MLLEGLHIPLTTPFQSDGRVALPKLAANVARYSKTPAAGLIVLGPSAEPTLLSDDETRDVLSIAAHAAAPEKVLIAGIARDSVRSVLALADFAAEQQYDAILVGVPDFLAPEHMSYKLDSQMRVPAQTKHTLLELRTYFQSIADRSPLPIILLNRPGWTIPLSIMRRVSTHPNIIGLCGTGISKKVQDSVIASLLNHTADKKREVTVTHTFAAVTARMKLAAEATPALVFVGSLTNSATTLAEPPTVAPILRTRTKSVDFQIVSGNSISLLEALTAGATGIAPAFAAAAPQACYEIYAAWKDCDQPLAEEKQARIGEAAALAESLGPGGLKYACDLNGYAGGFPRLPHLPPTGDQRAALEAVMHPLRN